MESRRDDLARAAGGWRGSGASEGREDAGTEEPESAWTGVKKPRIQSTTTTSGDLVGNVACDDAGRSSGEIKIVHGQEQEQEIEGLDWDGKKLTEAIRALRTWYDSSDEEDYDNERWAKLNEEQQREVNQRLALYRIRAYKKKYRDMDNETLSELFPPKVLEDNWYYEQYECDFDWFFDPRYCKLVHVEDYQRMVLQVTVEFDGLGISPTHNKLMDDQQFVQFWEKLSRKTKLIGLYRAERSEERLRIENLLLYHALKIAEDFPAVYNTTIVSRIYEFIRGLADDYLFAGFFTTMWELLANYDDMNFTDALRFGYNEGKYPSMFIWGDQFETNLYPMESNYKCDLDRIVEKVQDSDDAHQLVMDAIVENFYKPRRYYDYVRKKLCIAEEIGLIPKQPPHK